MGYVATWLNRIGVSSALPSAQLASSSVQEARGAPYTTTSTTTTVAAALAAATTNTTGNPSCMSKLVPFARCGTSADVCQKSNTSITPQRRTRQQGGVVTIMRVLPQTT